MPVTTFLKSLAQELSIGPLMAQDSSVVVAVSGGPDSMALLNGFHLLNQELGYQLRLHVAHLDHRLRGFEAEKDAAFVQAAADAMDLPCTVERIDIADVAAGSGGSIEEVARGERYSFLERVAIRTGSRIVAVGHQADDNAETILHRIVRGTGLRGLCGIPRRRSISPGSSIQLVRPLLPFTRKQVLEFLDQIGSPYREDRTNESNEAMRNRIRNLVMPLLEEQINVQVREALLRLGEQANWLEEFLAEMVQKTLETLVVSRTDKELVLNAHALGKRSRIVQTELIRRAISSFDIGEQDINFSQVVSVVELAADPASGKQLSISGGMTITKRYDRLIFSISSPEPRESIASEVAVIVPGVTHLPLRGIRIECDVITVTHEDMLKHRASQRERLSSRSATAESGSEEWLDYLSVHLPLVVRNRRSGDRFWPLGAPGSKKLSEFLTDAKVDPDERDRVSVLCDQLGPVWIIGLRIDERTRMTAATRQALKLRVRPVGD